MAFIFLAGCQNTGSTERSLDSNVVDVNDSVTSLSRGKVIMIDEVQVTNEQLRNQASHKGNLGMAVGGTVLLNSDSSIDNRAGVALLAVGATRKARANADANRLIPATRYTVELENGNLAEVFQTDSGEIQTDNRVLIRTYQSGKVQISLDRT